MIPIDEIRRFAMSLTETVEAEHWGKPSFRVNNKIFVVIQADGSTITIRTTKEERELYTSVSPEVYSVPDAFSNLNYMHINLELARLEEVHTLIKNAWCIVAPKKLLKALLRDDS